MNRVTPLPADSPGKGRGEGVLWLPVPERDRNEASVRGRMLKV